MTQEKIAIFGGGFNPPGIHHVYMVYALLQDEFDVIIVPSGNLRPDKIVDDIATTHRIRLMQLGFKIFLGSDVVRLDLSDLEKQVFTPTHNLQACYEAEGEVWHAVGADWIIGGGCGKSRIQLEWEKGREIWSKLNFVVFEREGYFIAPQDLPPHSYLTSSLSDGSSSEIRKLIASGRRFEHLVMPDVAEYIKEHGLYLPKGERP